MCPGSVYNRLAQENLRGTPILSKILIIIPTIIREQGYRFFFYSKEGNEPVHIHVNKDDMLAKY